MMQTYDKGDVLRVIGTFTDVDNALVDPGSVVFSYRTPAGTKHDLTYLQDPEVIRESPGVYYFDLSFTESGQWCVAYRSSGNGQAAAERNYFVRTSCF
jgi:hypothetical protein